MKESNSTQIIIRKALKKDLPAIAEIAAKAFKNGPDAYWAVIGFKHAQRTFVAEVSGKIIGAVEIEVIRLGAHRHGHIGYIFVDPLFQRKGVGSMLAKKAEDFFMSKNAVASWALTSPDNEGARKLFKRLGYEELTVNDVVRELGEINAEKLLRRMIYWEGDIILRKRLTN